MLEADHQPMNEIVELTDLEEELVNGGIVPLLLVGVAAAGVITGAGIYLATEYLS